ncbi:tol-pal system protein YbgF [Roseovarius nitratireducens]|uniref:tol-pal system protein YbgF n=1 Tax=Roseovarius nitratireducens TaxID=2044597 RepID=UPI000CE28655|nr:tol-pal system protein YbgF [Roseovarius nitratireducens]
MRATLKAIALTLLLAPAGAAAQGAETLADIRQELTVLFVELQKLKRELSTTGGAAQPAGGGPMLDRVNAIEAQVERLTGKTEELEFRIDRVVRDGTNRVGDLEFRLCEMEPGCDIAGLEPGDTLGGVAPNTGGGTSPGAGDGGDESDGPQLAVGERDDFERAQAAFEAGEHAQAAEQLATFLADYPGSPLSGQARLLRGRALEADGQQGAAARAFLDTFSAAPDGPEAAQALYLLGRALGRLGQTEDACVTLGQVAPRYPGAEAVAEAEAEMARLDCS